MRRLNTLLIVMTGIWAVKFIQGQFSIPTTTGNISVTLGQLAYTPVVRPGIFVVAHIALYGPFFILLLFYWKRTCDLLHENGIGVTLAAFAGLLLSINSQSRIWINVFPMVLPFLIKALDDRIWRFREVALLAGSSLLLSKVWFTINTAPFHGRLLEFPDQGFLMAFGPWMSPTMYALQGTVFLALGVALYTVFCNRARPLETTASVPLA
jgi:hypothetical protein